MRMTEEQLRAALEQRMGRPLTDRIVIDWFQFADAVQLHGDAAIDEMAEGVRDELEHPFGRKVDSP